MRLIRPRFPVLGLLARSAVIPAVLLATSNMAMVMFAPAVHMAVVGVAGVLAATSAVTMSVIASRRNDGRAVWIGMAFSVIATMLLIHGLATPGMIVPANGLVQIAGALNLPICGTILAASGLPILRRPRRVKLLLAIQFLVVAALAAAGAVALVHARSIPLVPNPSTVTANLIFVAGAVPLALLAWRAARTYLLTRRLPDLIVVEGVVWLIAAQYGLLNFTMSDGAWWLSHLLEVAGIGMVGIPVALDLRHAVASRPLVGDLRAADLVEHEEAFLGGRVRALLVRLGEKDPSTEGHTRRVATLAVAIGEHLGLPEGRLRQLALGGLLHDVGKLSVPNEILGKPGRLTDDEFDEIRRHPGAGRELLAELGGFSPLVLDLVESHHERLDGNGYPNRRPAGELDLAVRILTVADVYDALTADRVYREAWPAERALALLDEETGLAFDPECVAALRAVVAPERIELSPAPAPREPEPTPARGLPGPIFGEAAA
ncbi:MAG TPA: HD-GYP domain-containing protein [Solirubrobacteraceae bacterium]|nr:HD-GYP domain-containing protein [Solirubrobacteraceae bacterium]